MAKQSPDYALERDGVSLADWLWRLLDEEQKTRAAAGEAIQAMDMGVPSVHTDWADLESMPDVMAQRKRLEQAVHAIVGGRDFDPAGFVRKLVAYRLALSQDWRRRVDQLCDRDANRDKKFDRLADRLVEKIKSNTFEGDKQHAREHLLRLSAVYICGACDCKTDPCAGAEAMSPASLSAHRVFDILTTELLAAPDALQVMLDEEGLRQHALTALARIGPPAVAFAPPMIEQIDRLPERSKDHRRCFDGPHALGAIGRGDATTVAAVIRLLAAKRLSHRAAAAQTAEHLGAEVCGREEEIVALLEALVARDDEYFAALPALASVGRHLGRVRERVIALARPRPPKWRKEQWPPGTEEKYDAVMFERGVALSAMKYFADYAGECMPVLLDAMDTFEEFDPDEMYGGPHGRICTVLARLGAKAAAAADLLVSSLAEDCDELPRHVLEALAEMGPAASHVIPRLLPFREKYANDDPLEDLDVTLVDRYDDIVGWAIQRIRGQQ